MEKVKSIIERYKLKSLIFTAVVVFVTAFGLLNYVSETYGGNINWLIMPSEYFGVPEELKDEVTPLYKPSTLGWDGQFYYYISNDILGTKDTAEHIDSPSYRYQRIGLPLVARCVAWIFGQKHVSVLMYICVNLAILAVGVYVFARFLEQKRNSLLWILPWIFSVGCQITLRHALPDGAADTFMLIALVLLMKKKYIGYSVVITMASLCREANISVAAVIFLLGFFGLLEKEKKYNIKFASILAAPGVVFVAWYLYVSIHFGVLPYKQAHFITDIFGKGFITYFGQALENRNILEIISLLIYAVMVILALVLEVCRGRKNHIWWAFVPFTVLLGCFGSTVMAHYSGYLKGISSLLIFIPVMLLENESVTELESEKVYRIEKYVLAAIFAGVFIAGFPAIKNHARWGLTARYFETGRNENSMALTDFSSEISLNSNKGAKWSNMPYASAFNSESKYVILNVHIKNNSNQIWYHAPNSEGRNAVYLSYHWFRADNMQEIYLDGFRNSIGNDIPAGGAADLDMYVELPQKPGQYVLRLTLVQEGVAWFYGIGGAGLDLNYIIK